LEKRNPTRVDSSCRRNESQGVGLRVPLSQPTKLKLLEVISAESIEKAVDAITASTALLVSGIKNY
tara:strand:+ start:275 stop:472 length:198 start_codon:yes stop_codon:yes gene_type:complete